MRQRADYGSMVQIMVLRLFVVQTLYELYEIGFEPLGI